jgi:hypothetical protein
MQPTIKNQESADDKLFKEDKPWLDEYMEDDPFSHWRIKEPEIKGRSCEQLVFKL